MKAPQVPPPPAQAPPEATLGSARARGVPPRCRRLASARRSCWPSAWSSAACSGRGCLGSERHGPARVASSTFDVARRRQPGATATETLLEAAGVIEHPTWFRGFLAVRHERAREAGARRASLEGRPDARGSHPAPRSPFVSEAGVRVLVPEGWNRFQIAARLEELRVCSRHLFEEAATEAALLSRLGIRGQSAEGYLFPATYDLFEDAAANAVVTELVTEAKKRLVTLRARQTLPDFARLESNATPGTSAPRC